MAIDTANKRASAILPLLPFRGKLPFPDGTIDAADRAQLAFMYAGFGSAPVVPTGVPAIYCEPQLVSLYAAPSVISAYTAPMQILPLTGMQANLFTVHQQADLYLEPMRIECNDFN